MNITINGSVTAVDDSLTLLSLLEQKGKNPAAVVAELNREIIKRETFGDVTLSEGDVLEILSFVGGGSR